MSIVKTTEDGWDCVPELKEVTNTIDNMSSHIYEIKNCVRSSHLDNLVLEMKEMLEEALDLIQKIDIDREFKTVEDTE